MGLEIGVGTGARAASWLDKFKRIDAEAGTGYYDRLQFLLGDYSPTSLEARARRGEAPRRPRRGVPLDALNPFKSLSSYRFKIMYVHSTNTYDNLPFDDLVRRDGKLYLVEVRPYLHGAAADELAAEFGVSRDELPAMARRLLDGGPFAVYPDERGIGVLARGCGTPSSSRSGCGRSTNATCDHVPPGLHRTHLDDLLAEAPDDVRFHISRGAGESFVNTAPLLHPRGYLRGAGHLRHRHGRLPQGLPRARQARRIVRHVGERRVAARGRRPRRVRRALRAVPVPPGTRRPQILYTTAR